MTLGSPPTSANFQFFGPTVRHFIETQTLDLAGGKISICIKAVKKSHKKDKQI